ncbi:MAG: ATP-dependent 6-phosphofructokinase, partial [Oscillospiraceae bacterium]
KGLRVMGIDRGYNGLIHEEIKEMNLRSVSEIIHRGGTVLYTARCMEFITEEGQKQAADTCRKFGIDAVVILGGDGSFRGGRDLVRQGIPCVCIPCTIDNDISCTEYTIGFDTAMNTAVEMIDKLRDTTQSHDRCSVVEVMGRHAGYLAINVGIATGALVTLIPEDPWDLQKDVIDRMIQTKATGKKHFIILVAEGVGHTSDIAMQIQEKTGIESRATILGHVQRGGSPSVRDRVIASEMGYYAIELLLKGKYNRVIGLKQNALVDYDVEEALEMHKEIDELLPEIAKVISL